MTDLEKWRALLQECGIKFTEEVYNYKNYWHDHPNDGRSCTSLQITEDGTRANSKISGYSGFFTIIEFDNEDGSLIEIGAWE